MPQRWAFLVGIEKPLHPTLERKPFAEADAHAWSRAFTKAQIPLERQFVLVGSHATKTALESRLRALKRAVKKGDHVHFVWLGSSFVHDDETHLTCWDTLPDDLTATSLPVSVLMHTLSQVKAEQLVAFFSPTEHRTADFAGQMCFLSHSEGERSVASTELRCDLWSNLVCQAFQGETRKALTGDGHLTASRLQAHLVEELPRRVRKFGEDSPRPTPTLLGVKGEDATLATFATPSTHGFDPKNLHRLCLRKVSTSKFKDLRAFRKTHTIPDKPTPSSRKFAQRLATDDLKLELDLMFELCREKFAFKRKDLSVRIGQDGIGSLRTPEFEFSLAVELDADDASLLRWQREVGQFENLDFFRSTEFIEAIGTMFDQFVFEFAKPIDVASFVDRLEDSEPSGLKVNTDPEGDWCDVSLTGFAGKVRLTRQSLVISGRTGNAGGWFDLFQEFLNRVSSVSPKLLSG